MFLLPPSSQVTLHLKSIHDESHEIEVQRIVVHQSRPQKGITLNYNHYTPSLPWRVATLDNFLTFTFIQPMVNMCVQVSHMSYKLCCWSQTRHEVVVGRYKYNLKKKRSNCYASFKWRWGIQLHVTSTSKKERTHDNRRISWFQRGGIMFGKVELCTNLIKWKENMWSENWNKLKRRKKVDLQVILILLIIFL